MSKFEALAVIWRFFFNWSTFAAELVSVYFEDSSRLLRIFLFFGLTLGCVNVVYPILFNVKFEPALSPPLKLMLIFESNFYLTVTIPP